MANPTQLGSITGVGVGTERASEAMRCAVELDGGQEARALGQALSRHRCLSLGGGEGGASLTSQSLGFLMSNT